MLHMWQNWTNMDLTCGTSYIHQVMQQLALGFFFVVSTPEIAGGPEKVRG